MLRIPTHFIQIAVLLILAACGTTPALHESVIKYAKKPLAELIEVKIGGVDQWMLLRGADSTNPVLLFLHGGPGAGEMPLLRYYNYELEKYYTIVMWDQRGAGKNNRKKIPEETITMKQLQDDVQEVTNYLKERFNQPKIFLAGHSLGTVLGLRAIKQNPENYYAYVGIGQVVDMNRNIQSSFEKSTKLAEAIGKQRDIRIFSGMHIDGKYSGGTNLEKAVYMRDWIAKNGRIYYNRNNMNNLVWVVLTAPEYTVRDKLAYLRGLKKSRELLWTPSLFEVNFFIEARTLDVPIYFVSGKYDYITTHELTKEYYNFLEAPKKRLVTFEYSAHCAIFEEPQKFNRLLKVEVLEHASPSLKEPYLVKIPAKK